MNTMKQIKDQWEGSDNLFKRLEKYSKDFFEKECRPSAMQSCFDQVFAHGRKMELEGLEEHVILTFKYLVCFYNQEYLKQMNHSRETACYDG